MTSELITFNHLSCHSISTLLGTRVMIELTRLKKREIRMEKVTLSPPKVLTFRLPLMLPKRWMAFAKVGPLVNFYHYFRPSSKLALRRLTLWDLL